MKEFMVVKILWIQNKSKTGGMVHQMFSLVMQQGLSECIMWQDQTFALKETWNDAIKRENVDMVKNYQKIIQIFMLMWINHMLKPQNAHSMEKELWWQSSFTVKNNNNNNTKIKQKQKARKKTGDEQKKLPSLGSCFLEYGVPWVYG